MWGHPWLRPGPIKAWVKSGERERDRVYQQSCSRKMQSKIQQKFTDTERDGRTGSLVSLRLSHFLPCSVIFVCKVQLSSQVCQCVHAILHISDDFQLSLYAFCYLMGIILQFEVKLYIFSQTSRGAFLVWQIKCPSSNLPMGQQSEDSSNDKQWTLVNGQQWKLGHCQ